MPTDTEAKNPTPALPVPTEKVNVREVYTLHYHYGNVPHLYINFLHKGDIRSAIQRAKEHCVKMGYRFIKVRPFLFDLEDRENKRAAGEDYDVVEKIL